MAETAYLPLVVSFMDALPVFVDLLVSLAGAAQKTCYTRRQLAPLTIEIRNPTFLVKIKAALFS